MTSDPNDLHLNNLILLNAIAGVAHDRLLAGESWKCKYFFLIKFSSAKDGYWVTLVQVVFRTCVFIRQVT